MSAFSTAALAVLARVATGGGVVGVGIGGGECRQPPRPSRKIRRR